MRKPLRARLPWIAPIALAALFVVPAQLGVATPYYNLGGFWKQGACTIDSQCGTNNYCVGNMCKPTAASCLVLKSWGRGDGTYVIEPIAGQKVSVWCDNTYDGGGWTRVVNIQGNSLAHADNTGAVSDVSGAANAAKLSDAMINALNTVGYFRYNCGTTNAFVRNTSNTWTSMKTNSYNWSLDRGRDGTFECAANRSGYVFSDYPACSAGHSNYAASAGSAEGYGCYSADGGGWGRPGNLWAK